MKKLFSIICFVVIAGCGYSQSCKDLPASFSSYSQAIQKVKAATFQIMETTNTSGSSWITSAKYYSCDGETGYFIYTTIKVMSIFTRECLLMFGKDLKTQNLKGHIMIII